MVIGDIASRPAIVVFALQETVEPLVEQLDPPRRAAVVMAILALVLTGLALVACIMIGARWVRRLAREGRGRTKRTMNIENKRLRHALRPILPEGRMDETTVVNRNSDETVAEG